MNAKSRYFSKSCQTWPNKVKAAFKNKKKERIEIPYTMA
jgi:hypothetical protein